MEDLLVGVSVPAIAAVVYFVVELIKYTTNKSEKVLRLIPLLAAVFGLICGLICFYAIPSIMPTDNLVVALVIGGASGLTATGFNQIIKQTRK